VDFKVGDRVITPEGITGTITEALAGQKSYKVGGTWYRDSRLTPIKGTSDEVKYQVGNKVQLGDGSQRIINEVIPAFPNDQYKMGNGKLYTRETIAHLIPKKSDQVIVKGRNKNPYGIYAINERGICLVGDNTKYTPFEDILEIGRDDMPFTDGMPNGGFAGGNNDWGVEPKPGDYGFNEREVNGMILKTGNTVRLKHEKSLDRKIRGKVVEVSNISVVGSLGISLNGESYNIPYNMVQNLIPSIGDEVELNDGSKRIVSELGAYGFNNDFKLEDIKAIVSEAPIIRHPPGAIVTPINAERYTDLPRIVNTVKENNSMTFKGLTGDYIMSDFRVTAQPIPHDIRLFDEGGRKQLLHGTVPLKDFLMREYRISFEELSRVLNTTESMGLTCDMSRYPRVISLAKGKTVGDDRVTDVLSYINKVITETL